MLNQNASSCRLKSDIFNIWLMIAFILAIYFGFFFQSIVPAYNNDDARYILNQPNHFINGRWGIVLVQEVLSYNPIPGFSIFIMAVFYTATFSIAGSLFNLKHLLSKVIFICLSVFTQFYAALFIYDQVIIPVAIGDFLAITGLYCLLRRPTWIGVILLSLAPAFYTSSIHLAATLFVGLFLHQVTSMKSYQFVIPMVKSVILFIIALALFMLLNKIIGPILSPEEFKKTSLTSLGSLHFDNLKSLFLTSILPTSLKPQLSFNESAIVVCLAFILYIGFASVLLYRIYKMRDPKRLLIVIVFVPVFLVAPYFLTLIQGSDYPFSFRSLYALGLLRAICAAVTFDELIVRPTSRPMKRNAVRLVTLVSGAIIILPAIFSHQTFLKHHRSYFQRIIQSNVFLSRVEDLLASEKPTLPDEIPILNVYAIKPKKSAPSEIIPPAYLFSPGMLLTLIDRQYYSITLKENYIHPTLADRFPGSQNKTIIEIIKDVPGRGKWPSLDSVFLSNGIVVILN